MIIGEFADVYPPELDGVGMVMKSYVEELSLLGDECYYIAPQAMDNGQHHFQALLYRSVKMPRESYRVGIPALDRSYIQNEKLDGMPFHYEKRNLFQSEFHRMIFP